MTQDQGIAEATAAPTRRPGLSGRRLLVVALLLGLGPTLCLLLFPAARWALATSSAAVRLLWGAPAAYLLVALLITALKSKPAGAHGDTPPPAGRSGRRPVAFRHWLAALFLAGLVLGGDLAKSFATKHLERRLSDRFPHVQELYANHDIAKLVGQTLRVMILKARDGVGDAGERHALAALAERVPERWRRLADAGDPRIVPLTERELWAFVQRPEFDALDDARWKALLDEWADAARVRRLTPASSLRVATELKATFGFALREALKHDYVNGGKAWAAMQLDMMGELLRRSSAGASTSDPQVKSAMAGVARALPALDDKVAELRLQQSKYHDAVVAGFADIRGRLDEIARTVGAIKDDTDVLKQIEVVKADPSLSDQEKFARILKLAEPKPAAQDQKPETVELTPDIRAFVERMAANASLIDQHRAKVLLGDMAAADALADQYQHERASQRAAEDYTFAVTRGDRFWLAEDYDHAASWFAKAIDLRADDWEVLNKGALSLQRSGQSPAHGENLRRGRRWLERAIEVIAASRGADHPDLATCYSNLAMILQDLGDLPGARTRMERAIAIDEKHLDPDHPTLAVSYSNLATILQDLGDLPGARARMERAIAIWAKQFPPDRPTLATCHSNLAMILRALGDLPGARARMEWAIAIEEKHFDPDHPNLAVSYSNLALILKDLGDLPGARARMERAIAIDEKHFDPDHPTLATRYSNLAMILQDLEDLRGARARMERAIAIWEKHFDPDHPNLSAGYSNLAMILKALGDLPQARARIERAIEIGEKHFDPDHPTLATRYSNLAMILQDLGDLPQARARMERAIAIGEKHFDADHPALATSYNNMAFIEADAGAFDKALAWETRALAIRRTRLDQNHPFLMGSVQAHETFTRLAEMPVEQARAEWKKLNGNER